MWIDKNFNETPKVREKTVGKAWKASSRDSKEQPRLWQQLGEEQFGFSQRGSERVVWYFAHQRRLRFEDAVSEPLQTVPATQPARITVVGVI